MNITPIPAITESVESVESNVETAIETAIETVATIEPIPAVIESPPEQPSQPSQPVSPLVEIDALPTLLAYLGTQGYTVRDIGTSYVIDNEWETLEQLMGAQDSFATSRLMEDQIRQQSQQQQQQYTQPQPQNNGGALVAPYQLTPQTTVLNATPRNTVMATVQGLHTNTILLMLTGGVMALVGVLVLMSATREVPTERMVREQRELMEKSAATLSAERNNMDRNQAKLVNKAIDKAGNITCITIMGCGDPKRYQDNEPVTAIEQPRTYVKPEAAALLAKWKAKSSDPATLNRWASAMSSGNNANGLTEADMRGAMK